MRLVIILGYIAIFNSVGGALLMAFQGEWVGCMWALGAALWAFNYIQAERKIAERS